LGAGPDENAKKIRYTSKTLSEDDRERLSQMSQEEIEQEALQKEEGFKIWFAGKVIYVFNNQVDGPEGKFNEETEAYDFIGRYQLKLNRARSGVYLTVLTEDGLSAPAQVAEEILWDVKDNLPRG
ncbi:MAG: hypothetical protein KC477_04720, partial [Oceanospirillaceae bacterium]|nr:hypothetical protein [Oceanospirillaceae bacterium]